MRALPSRHHHQELLHWLYERLFMLRFTCLAQLKCCKNGCEKLIGVEWLNEERNSSCTQGKQTIKLIFPASEYYHARRGRNLTQSRLDFEPVHGWHADINHRDCGAVRPGIIQKVFRIAEFFRIPVGRGKQPADSFQRSEIVINHANFTTAHTKQIRNKPYLVSYPGIRTWSYIQRVVS